MIKKFLFILLICCFCSSCGMKSEPEYEAQINYNKVILIF